MNINSELFFKIISMKFLKARKKKKKNYNTKLLNFLVFEIVKF